MTYHESVLLKESIDGLDIKSGGIYVDVTYGGGGHSKEILKRLKKGRLIAFDQDEDALKNAIDDERLTMVNANFRYMKNFLMYHKALPVDGILADLGVSSHQIDNQDRGFSTRFDSELDMRMNTVGNVSAKEIISEYSVEQLSRVLGAYGELNHAGRIANAIVSERKIRKIETSEDLKNAIGKFAERGKENKFYAKVFQALRIEVNDEINALRDFLKQSTDVLKEGGRLVVISYHSLEDRLVKNFMKSGNEDGLVEKDFYGNEKTFYDIITRKPMVPGDDEIEKNTRARSAKLRIAVKK
jgi:16S rRNA (cytosine1402-N4)-methyltransferase